MYAKRHEATIRPVKLDIVISLCTAYNASLYVDCIIFPIMIAIMPFLFFFDYANRLLISFSLRIMLKQTRAYFAYCIIITSLFLSGHCENTRRIRVTYNFCYEKL